MQSQPHNHEFHLRIYLVLVVEAEFIRVTNSGHKGLDFESIRHDGQSTCRGLHTALHPYGQQRAD
eukprot:759061-Hanusia_phi.AAC.5